MLVKDRKIILAKFRTINARFKFHDVAIPTGWVRNPWNFPSTQYRLKDEELIIALPYEWQDWVDMKHKTSYRVLPFKPYIQGIIPKNAIYYDDHKIQAFPSFRQEYINLEI